MSQSDPGPTIRKRFTPRSERVKTWTEKDADGESQHFVRVPVSSTSEDRDGDQFTEAGLKNQQQQFDQDAVPMFLDHGASEDSRYATRGIAGKWESAEREGDVLYATARLNNANDDTEWLREYLEEDMPVGFSVGFRALEYDGDFEEGFEFDKVDLVETSAVGIPSNPDGVAAMSADESDWREELDQRSDDDPEEGSGDTMGKTDDNDDDQTTTELLRRVLDQQDEQIDALEEKVDDLADQLDKEDGSDDDEDDEEEDDDEEEEEGEDKSGDGEEQADEKGLTLVAGDDADEETQKELEELREKANDDGELTVDDSKTTLFGDEEDAVDEEPGDEKGAATSAAAGWGLHE